LNRKEALTKLRGRVSGDSAHFSNVNTAKPVWWLDIPAVKITSGKINLLTFVLYDQKENVLHILEIPTDFLRNNIDHLYPRPDKEMFSFQLSAERANKFESVKPAGSDLQFGQFLKESVRV
jgi:hypothetical protein